MISILRKTNRKGEKKDGTRKSRTLKKKTQKRVSTVPPQLEDIPRLLDTMLNSKDGKRAAAAAKIIVDLCDNRNEQNRIRMVWTKEYNVLPALIQCLATEENEARRILACAALLNLSSSHESTRGIVHGPWMNGLIQRLCNIISRKSCREELRGLSLLCVRNLSMAAGIKNAFQESSNGKDFGPLKNPNSLFRVLEKSLKDQQLSPGKQLVTVGLIRNLACRRENAVLIAKTQIPELLLDNIRASSVPTTEWKSTSLEKVSLDAIRNLGRWPGCRETLIRIGTFDVMKAIIDSKRSSRYNALRGNPQQSQRLFKKSSDASLVFTADLTVHYDETSSSYNIATTSDSNDEDHDSFPVSLENQHAWAVTERNPFWMDRNRSKGRVLEVMTYQSTL